MKTIQFKQQKPEKTYFETTNLEKVASALTFVSCTLDQLEAISVKDLDATNGATILSAIKNIRFHEIMIKDVLDDLKILEGREPWGDWQ